MPLPTRGKIAISAILREMGRSNTKIGIDQLAALWYTNTRKSKFNNKTHNLSDWYGERWIENRRNRNPGGGGNGPISEPFA